MKEVTQNYLHGKRVKGKTKGKMSLPSTWFKLYCVSDPISRLHFDMCKYSL